MIVQTPYVLVYPADAARSLQAAPLVRHVHPDSTLLGFGRRAFTEKAARTKLERLKAKAYVRALRRGAPVKVCSGTVIIHKSSKDDRTANFMDPWATYG
jgi:hypothetical protein